MKAEYGISLQLTDREWKKASLTLEESDRLNGETPEEFLTRTASTLENWFKSKAETPPPSTPAGELPVINRKEQRILELIEDATDTETLQGYQVDCNTTATISAWKKRYAELIKQQ